MSRKVAREETMKLLYQMEINNDFSESILKNFVEARNFNNDEIQYIRDSILHINNNKKNIDQYINKYAQGWKLNRIAKIDLSLLRIAIHEILFRDDIPIEVSINEALELSKKYSTKESSKFINGILGSFVREWKDINE